MRISIQNINLTLGGIKIINWLSLEINPGEQWALIGESGSGKTTLARAIARQVFFNGSIEITKQQSQETQIKIELINQQHKFKNKFNTNQFYYQQRFNSSDSEETITVIEELKAQSSDESEIRIWTRIFSLDQHLEKSMLLLSNGENKRLQLIKAMLKKPDLLILDNPFIGLDIEGRKDLATQLDLLSIKGVKLIIIAQEKDLPKCISNIAVLNNGSLVECRKPSGVNVPFSIEKKIPIQDMPLPSMAPISTTAFSNAIKMVNVNIVYNKIPILKNINWQVKKGERWAISGPNGSGKSTLLSLINADNPQAYANEIYIFDRKKGSGESIWDIKKNIGFLSPELHLYFEKGITCFETIASGLFDTIGLFRKPNNEQRGWIKELVNLFGLEDIEHSLLERASLGRQRLVLLARALIKRPSLLILDEPCQGLDQTQIEHFKQLINSICIKNDLTLIYVSHYDSDWPSCINKILKLDHGTIV